MYAHTQPDEWTESVSTVHNGVAGGQAIEKEGEGMEDSQGSWSRPPRRGVKRRRDKKRDIYKSTTTSVTMPRCCCFLDQHTIKFHITKTPALSSNSSTRRVMHPTILYAASACFYRSLPTSLIPTPSSLHASLPTQSTLPLPLNQIPLPLHKSSQKCPLTFFKQNTLKQ